MPLRVGLVLDSSGESPILKRFQAEVVRQIQESSFGRIEAIVPHPPPSRKKGAYLFRQYERWDRARFEGPDGPSGAVDCSQTLGPIPRIPPRDTNELDVLLAIQGESFDELARFPSRPRYGIWALHYGDFGHYDGTPPYFWEMYDNNEVSGVTLLAIGATTHVLAKGQYSTLTGVSLSRNRIAPYWASVALLIEKLRQLHDLGWDALLRSASGPVEPSKSPRGMPTNWQTAKMFYPRYRKYVSKTQPHVWHWRIATRLGGKLDPRSPDLSGFRFHESPPGHYYADPFLVTDHGKKWLFFEDYIYARRHGVIACAEVLADGALGPATTVIETSCHMSYPCLIRENEQLFMIPETEGNTTVDLYRCVTFPHQWAFEKHLLGVRAVDSTVFRHQGRLWMITSVVERHGRTRQLWLFSSPSLLGQWSPHPANPISCDTRKNRGGGAVFEHDGMLIRVSQSCVPTYGFSFAFHQITRLTPTEYEERELQTVLPNWAAGIGGTHTYARSENVEAVDAASFLPASPSLVSEKS